MGSVNLPILVGWFRHPAPGCGLIVGHARQRPRSPSRLRCFITLCPARCGAVFVIVGHPRQMEPRTAHDHIRATLADPEAGFARVHRIFIVVDVPLRQVGDLDDGLGHSVSSGASPGASSGASSPALPDGPSVLSSARIR